MVYWVGSGAFLTARYAVARFVADGRVVTPTPFQIVGGPYRALNEDGTPAENIGVINSDWRKHGPLQGLGVALAAGATSYLTAWTTDYTSGRSFGPNGSNARLHAAEGHEVDVLYLGGPDFRGKFEPYRIRGPALAWDGLSYVATWHQIWTPTAAGSEPFVRVFASRVSEAGALIGEVLEVAGAKGKPSANTSVASDAQGATLIVYEQHPNDGSIPIKVELRMLTR